MVGELALAALNHIGLELWLVSGNFDSNENVGIGCCHFLLDGFVGNRAWMRPIFR